jgi:sn-glycerol 3-phosphate transport system ATP-binding protein
MASISFKNVVKRYGTGKGSVQVLHGVDAQIADHEFIVIVGPSGCGKSTLLRMVAGLEEISAGEISIGGRVVNDLEPSERDIAMVFQNYALYPHMSVFDNMAYGLKIAKVPVGEIRTRVDKAAKILELGALLEPKLRVQTRLEIQKLHRELGITSLFVTHDQVEAMTLAQRMMVMNAGRMEQFGTPEEVYNRPATTFVASFMGSPPMNLLKHAANTDFGGRTQAILGIRPEHLQVGSTGWAVQVDTIEMLGAERLLYCRLGEEFLIVRTDESLSVAPEIGMTIHVEPRPDRLHWFDAKTGRRI